MVTSVMAPASASVSHRITIFGFMGFPLFLSGPEGPLHVSGGVSSPNRWKQQMPHSFISPGFSSLSMGSACSSQTTEVQQPMIWSPMASFPQTSQVRRMSDPLAPSPVEVVVIVGRPQELLLPVLARVNRGSEVPDGRGLDRRAERAEGAADVICLLPDRAIVHPVMKLHGIAAGERRAHGMGGLPEDEHREAGQEVLQEPEMQLPPIGSPAFPGNHRPEPEGGCIDEVLQVKKGPLLCHEPNPLVGAEELFRDLLCDTRTVAGLDIADPA